MQDLPRNHVPQGRLDCTIVMLTMVSRYQEPRLEIGCGMGLGVPAIWPGAGDR